MFKKSITAKLFVITFIFLFVFLAAAMVFQYTFFETFYLNSKISRLQENIEQFKEGFPMDFTSAEPVTGPGIRLAVPGPEAFETTSGASIAFYGEGAGVYHTAGATTASITAKTFSTSTLRRFENQNNSMMAIVSLEGDTLMFSGASLSSTDELLRDDNVTFSGTGLISAGLQPAVTGAASDAAPAEIRMINYVDFAEINDEIQKWKADTTSYDNVVKQGKTETKKIDIPELAESKLLVISPIVKNGKTESILFSLTTLQPVSEAAEVIKMYSVYILAAAVLLIVVLSLIYSNMISKPLIRINNSAAKIADLDFSEVCRVTSQDELGNLAGTLNFLSAKLDGTLKDLRHTNRLLKDDIDKQKQLDRMRKDFVATVSHEMKTPLSLMQGYAEGLDDNIPDEAERKYFTKVIIDESKRLSNLVNELLDLSQLESGSFSLLFHEFSMRELVEAVTRKYTQLIKEKKLAVEIQDLYEPFFVNADYQRIEQVLVNLLDNAWRYTPDGSAITVRMYGLKNTVLVEIENEGQPIPEKELENIWEKFYKVDKSGNRSKSGTGIGLSVVRSILERHGSKYGVKNITNGVRFFFELEKAGLPAEERDNESCLIETNALGV